MPVIVLASPSGANTHSRLVQRRWLCKVTNIKLDMSVAHVITLILNAEVEPLVMTSGVGIYSHE